MKLIDWTKVYEEYKGNWVALSADNETVVGSGKTAKEALDQAHGNGFGDAAITYVPEDLGDWRRACITRDRHDLAAGKSICSGS
jgi:hypothetical protein